MGPQDQPAYLNAVCRFRTRLGPAELLTRTQAIETARGRHRAGPGAPATLRWGPRPLDLDILLYADRQIDTPRLTIPHPGIALRSFVLQPLFDLAPRLVIPGAGPVGELLQHCERFDIRPF